MFYIPLYANSFTLFYERRRQKKANQTKVFLKARDLLPYEILKIPVLNGQNRDFFWNTTNFIFLPEPNMLSSIYL